MCVCVFCISCITASELLLTFFFPLYVLKAQTAYGESPSQTHLLALHDKNGV
jgi:hypothetical protein